MKCPEKLEKMESEENYKDNIEVHIIDGVDMGTQENNMKGFLSDDIFKLQRVSKGGTVKGTDCFERSLLPKKKMRDQIKNIVTNSFIFSSFKIAIKTIEKMSQNNLCVAISKLLKYTQKMSEIPSIYKSFIKELRKDSPINIWLPAVFDTDFSLLHSFLTGKVDVFADLNLTSQLTHAFPYVTKVICDMLEFHDVQFLPEHLNELFLGMLELRENFNNISYERAAPRTKPKNDYNSCRAECYPNNRERTMENTYEADTYKDKTEDKKCEKAYNSKPTITGGLKHMSCKHGVVKGNFLLNAFKFAPPGFTALQRGESPLQVLGPALRRLPARVKASRRFFIYDNACAGEDIIYFVSLKSTNNYNRLQLTSQP